MKAFEIYEVYEILDLTDLLECAKVCADSSLGAILPVTAAMTPRISSISPLQNSPTPVKTPPFYFSPRSTQYVQYLTMPGIITTDDNQIAPFPAYTKERVQKCAFSQWYGDFEAVTLKTIIIKPLPEEFISYLNADGVFLPLDK